MKYFNQAKENFLSNEQYFSKYATKNSEAIRLKEIDDDIRTPFFRDVDRIIYAFSYSRYADKTQVHSYKENDHISKRMIHVQFVSKIARTIGRALSLNTDLIEAIALGHDIGHPPLGHFGEYLLNEISIKELNQTFAHNIQSVRHYMNVENNGRGLNLTIQVLDGIMCHNGEMLSNTYIPVPKTKEQFIDQYNLAYSNYETSKRNCPMTLEGCVVRISDVIGYIGKDIEDAIELGILKREDLPKEITDILGTFNKDIIDTIVRDIIDNSMNKNYISMSKEVYNALWKLKEFNYQHIYSKSMTEEEKNYYRNGMNKIYQNYLNAITTHDKTNIIYKIFLDSQDINYINNTNPKRIVIDFIAGMTDDLFLHEIERVN
ncbi:MAG: HD domain-containing protein [Bacilli bacterium]|nr:HD domain-containing protein [Bacilli bacterium]